MVKYWISFGCLIAAGAGCGYAALLFAWMATVAREESSREQATALYAAWEAGLWVFSLGQLILAKRALDAWRNGKQIQPARSEERR